MFDNSGGKIKIVAVIFAILGILTCVICGLVILAETFMGIVVIIVGSLSMFVSSLVLYAFGVIVESIEQINYNVSDISSSLRRQQRATSQKPSTTKVGGATSTTKVSGATSSISYNPTKPRVKTPTERKDWVCRKCGCLNSSLKIMCSDCGEYK